MTDQPQTGTAVAAPKKANPITIIQQTVQSKADEFCKALPGHITPERFVRTAQTAIAMTRNIDKVKNVGSLLAACTKAASDGLILDGREAALVVDYNGDVQYRPMVRGLLKLAYNSGQIKSLVVETACEADFFLWEPTNPDKPIQHNVEVRKPRGDVFLVYALATLKDGGIVHAVMTVDGVNRIRDRSDAYKAFKAQKIKSTPWSTDWEEMAKKTVFRRLSKSLPSSTDREQDRFHQAIERIDDDFTFEPATVPPVEPPAPRKKRGAGAAAMAAEPAKDPLDLPESLRRQPEPPPPPVDYTDVEADPVDEEMQQEDII